MLAPGMKIPEEEEQRNIIDKLANFVARNGPKFEELTKSKQRDNPKFGFLFGGDFHEYYKWKVSLEATQADAQKRLQHVKEQKEAQIQLEESKAASSEEEQHDTFNIEQFRELVQKLILACTKDNIQNGKNWILTKAKNFEEKKIAARFLLRRMLEENLPFQQKLHIVYLANDILHHSRKKDVPELQDALKDYILAIIGITYNGEPQEHQEKLCKVLKIWAMQKFFDDEIRQKLQSPAMLYDEHLDLMETQRQEMENEVTAKEEEKQIFVKQGELQEQNEKHDPEQHQSQQGLGNYGEHQIPPEYNQHAHDGQYDQYKQQWVTQQPDPYHFYGEQYQRPPIDGNQQGFPSFQGGFEQGPPLPHGHLPPHGPPPPGYNMPSGFHQGPSHQVQTFDYSHQSAPGIDQVGGGPITIDYEHGRAPVPEGAPPMQEHDPTIPLVPYYDLPAGLMVPLVKLWDCEYKPLDPKDIRLPIPQPPSERLLAAIEAFYSPPSHDRPRDSQGWEKNGLFEFFKAKIKYIKDKDRKLEVFERTPSPPPSRSSTPESEGTPLVKERVQSRTPSLSPGRRRSKSRSSERKRSYSRSRSKSGSRSPFSRRSRSHSYSRSKSRSRSRTPPRRSPLRRSPTPPATFLGFETRSVESKIEETNVGHQLLKKMGWGGQGLGKKESGILDPIKAGEVRDKQDMYKGIGVEMNDPFEQFRKNRSYTYTRPQSKR